MTAIGSARYGRWYPDCTQHSYERRPDVGMVLAMGHAVWRIVAVEDIPWSDADRRMFDGGGFRVRPGAKAEDWLHRPFRVAAEWIGGVRPEWVTDEQRTGHITIRSTHTPSWKVYPGGRWPQCSCCGEPMPCRAAITDVKVDAEMERLATMDARLPGTCWGCGEPVTSRQRSVTYSGDNVDLPGGPTVVFHARRACSHLAEKYELRWLEGDPTRVRMLTWPKCRGCLYWHADGSSECVGGHPDCRGFETHAHGSQAGCAYMDDGCRRCPPGPPGGSYCNPKRLRRPWMRPADLPQGGDSGRPGGVVDLDAADDGQEKCPGTLLVHRDGSTVCVRGGLDDCWDGSKYAHAKRRDCREQSAGCPTCETTEDLS